MRTIPEAAKALNRSESFLRRGIEAGKWNVFQAGRHVLVDVDDLAQQIGPDRSGLDVAGISKLTGLSQNQVRQGIQDGWLPHWKNRKKYLMDPEEVKRAILDRMQKK